MTGRNMKRWSYSELKGQWIIFYPLVHQRLNADEGSGQSITLLVRNTLESNLELFVQNINAQSNFLFRNLAYGQSHSVAQRQHTKMPTASFKQPKAKMSIKMVEEW